MNFPHTATISRMGADGDGYTYSSTGTTSCFLQPLDTEETQLFGMAFGKASVCYLPFTADVQTSDKLVIDGHTYGVKGVRSHNYGNLKHQRAILERL